MQWLRGGRQGPERGLTAVSGLRDARFGGGASIRSPAKSLTATAPETSADADRAVAPAVGCIRSVKAQLAFD